jgi:hypothetical protein
MNEATRRWTNLVRLDLVPWVNPLVLDFEQFIQIVDKLIEDLWVLFRLNAHAEVVHLFSFLSGHGSASKGTTG